MLALIVMMSWIAVVAITFVVAWRSKDPMLRAAALTLVIGWLATLLTENIWPHWYGPHVGVLLIDAAAALVFGWIAVSDRTWWSMSACGFQIATVGLHLSYLLAPKYLGSAYYTGLTLLGFLLAFSILAGGLVKAPQRHRRG